MAGCRLNVLAGSDKKQEEKKKIIQEQEDFGNVSMDRGQRFEPKESCLILEKITCWIFLFSPTASYSGIWTFSSYLATSKAHVQIKTKLIG